MPPEQPVHRPGFNQRRRCCLALVSALLVWGLRWLWPLQFLPGWLVVAVVAWAVIELVNLLWWPRRWN
ncbi:MAG: hypothetical protein AB8B70_02570 [Prochlorococcus sp.]|nr:hypothetical protein [Prochlorococcaceae cyanobacterium Fu_MAG_50]